MNAVTLDEAIRCGDISLGRGNIISSKDIATYPGDYPIYSSSAKGSGEFGRYGHFMFNEELITWSVDGGGRFFFRPKHKFSVTNVCGYMRVDQAKWNMQFVYYSLGFQHRRMTFDYQTKAHPSVVRHLYQLPSEPEPVQSKIAEILSTMDRAIEQTEALIAKQQRIKTGLMQDLLTRGIDEQGNLRSEETHQFKDSLLGRIPVEWDVRFLDSLAERGSGHTPNKLRPAYWNGGIKWVSLADSRKLDDLYISETDKEISELGLKNSSAVLHPAGTVILSRDAGVGKSAILAHEMAVSQHFMAWRCKPKKLDNIYLYYWLQQDKPKFEGIASGSTIVTIGLQFFREYSIAVPREVTEQIAISTKLNDADAAIAQTQIFAHKLHCLKTALMQDLLTGKKRVTLLLEPAMTT
ncbi:restriction endonuclease subunit S [bacterium]|nr:restriction endonuclease subunit S [bacterium]